MWKMAYPLDSGRKSMLFRKNAIILKDPLAYRKTKKNIGKK